MDTRLSLIRMQKTWTATAARLKQEIFRKTYRGEKCEAQIARRSYALKILRALDLLIKELA